MTGRRTRWIMVLVWLALAMELTVLWPSAAQMDNPNPPSLPASHGPPSRKTPMRLVVATAHHVFDRARRGTEALLSRPGRLDERLAAIAAVVLALPQPFTSYDALRHEAMLELTPDAQQEMWHAEEALATLIERTFAEAAAAGDITTPDPRLAAHSFLALLRVGQSRTIDGQPRFPDAQRTAAELVGMLWHGIGGRSTPSVH